MSLQYRCRCSALQNSFPILVVSVLSPHIVFFCRWIFDILKFPRTKKTVILNGFIMLLTFFLFRMITMPVYWYQIWLVSGTDDTLKLGYIQLIMYIPCFVLDALNIFWFSKMCKGFLKALKGLMNSTNNDKEKQL